MAETISPPTTSEYKGNPVKFSLNFKKQNYSLEFGDEETIGNLRQLIAKTTGVEAGLQKIMFKGLLKDDSKTMKEVGIVDGSKVMLIGSTIAEVMATNSTTVASQKIEEKNEQQSSEPLSDQLPHKRIIEKGVPSEAVPGIKGRNESLPPSGLQGILNNTGMKVRLTFKSFTQELWISSVSNTQKIPYASIRKVTSEPIKGQEEYHIMSLQLGSSENTKYMLYFVPAQYSRAIKNEIMADAFGGFL